MKEWPLVLFTLLSQTSVGLVLAHQISGAAVKKTRNVWYSGFAFLIMALLFSTMDLGTPWGAYRSIMHIGESWLSREIFITGAFAFFLAAACFIEFTKSHTVNLRPLGLLSAALGIVLTFCMAKVYASTAVTAWVSFYTYVSFYMTAVFVGFFGYAVMLGYQPDQEETAPIGKMLLIGSGAALLQLLSLIVYLLSLKGTFTGEKSLEFLTEHWELLLSGQLFAVAAMALALFAYKNRLCRNKRNNGLCGALLLGILAALAGRYLFYASGMLPLGNL